MNRTPFARHHRRTAVAVAASLVLASCATASLGAVQDAPIDASLASLTNTEFGRGSSTGSASWWGARTKPKKDPCHPVGQLQELELNDRCVDSRGNSINWDADTLGQLGLWTATDSECPGVVMVAQEQEILITVDRAKNLPASVTAVAAVLSNYDPHIGPIDPDSTAHVIGLHGATPSQIFNLLPAMQGVGYSADLNYLEPLLPNNGFRPDDDPEEAAAPKLAKAGKGAPGSGTNVLVVDSSSKRSTYDIDGNGLVDEDHGHGEFVVSLIEQAAPGADVDLAGVTTTEPRLPSGRWAPMLFSDYDIIRSLESAFSAKVSYDVVNMSLGGAGCTDSRYGYGIGERLGLARAMRSLALTHEAPTYVAAAGNDGLEIKHFPAAFRDEMSIVPFAETLHNSNPAAALELMEIHDYFVDEMIAVGSLDKDGKTSSFSNCGDWVNAVADGNKQVAFYEKSKTNYASWSGTSFATANMSAALVGGKTDAHYPVAGIVCAAP